MWLVLCSYSDTAGIWAYEGLRRLGVTPLELVTSEALAGARLWEHRLDAEGSHVKITLADGRVLCSGEIRGALNRLVGPAPQALQPAAPADREYAQAELMAFYLSWVKALPGVVINRASALGLCGSWYQSSEWMCRAARAGLRTPSYRLSGRDALDQEFRSLAPDGAGKLSVIVLRGKVFGGRVSEGIERACGRLADDAEAEMLGVDFFAGADDEWTFAGAAPVPDLRCGGMPLLERLKQVLTQGGNA